MFNFQNIFSVGGISLSSGKGHSYNAGFDLVKAFLALLIVLIHTALSANKNFEFIAAPIARLAVPIFFIFSGYFFFHKLEKVPQKDHLKTLLKSIRRDVQLYLFWFIVLLLPTIYYRSYFANGFWNGIKSILTGFVFSSTFIASWYIMALIIGIPIIYLLSKFLNTWFLLLIAWLINCIYVIITNYGASPIGINVTHFLHATDLPYISFPVGLLWLVIGKLFAEGKLNKLISKNILYFLILAFIPLYIEQWYITVHHFAVTNDSYFMLLPVSVLLFGYILTIQINSSFEKELRAFATITYCLHATFAEALQYVFNLSSFYQLIFLWFITVVFCVIATIVITRLEKVEYFHWLRFSH